MMTRTILVPTDFSKNAWNALIFAMDLFQKSPCTFYLLNAYTVSGYVLGDMMVPEPGTDSFDNAKRYSEEGLQKVMEMLEFRDHNTQHRFEVISQFNDPLQAIKNVLNDKDIDLIVMGTKGASDDVARLFGTNTITVMEKIRQCPVLGIPLTSRIVHLKEIVFPTDYKSVFKRKEFEALREIALAQKAQVCILHVGDSDQLTKSQKEKQALLESCLEGVSFSHHFLSGGEHAIAVRHFVESRGSDMIAFINRKHTFFNSLFTRPMVKDLGLFSTVPVLALHDHKS